MYLDFTPLVAFLRITIWDAADKVILRTETVSLSTVNNETTFNIVDLELVKNHPNAIPMNTNDYFAGKSADGAITNYPITVGNICIDNYKERSG